MFSILIFFQLERRNMLKAFIVPHVRPGGRDSFTKNYIKSINFDYIFCLDGNLIDLSLPISKNNIKLFNYSNIYKKTNLKKLINFIFEVFKIKKQKKECDIRISLSLGEPANLFNLLSRIPKEKIVISFHSHYSTDYSLSPYWNQTFLDKLRKYFRIFIIKSLYNKADMMVAVSKNTQADLIKNFGLNKDKIRVIYNPFLIDEIKSKAEEDLNQYVSVFTCKTLITVGRLSKQKGQWYLLRIFKKLKENKKDLKLVIVGEGELKEYLINLSYSLGLKTLDWEKHEVSDDYDVYFLGFQDNPFKFLSRSTIFVLPSLWEGLPSVLIEALACGLPVISSDCRSGPREILSPDTDFEHLTTEPDFVKYGVLMPIFDGNFKNADVPLSNVENQWVITLEALLSDENLLKHYAKVSLERALDFDASKIATEWNKLFAELYN